MARFTPFYQEHFLTLRVLPVTTGRHLCTQVRYVQVKMRRKRKNIKLKPTDVDRYNKK